MPNKLSKHGRNEMLRDLLEDFEFIGSDYATAMIKRYPNWRILNENVTAALIASGLGLSSIDYAKKNSLNQGQTTMRKLLKIL